jgi:hypothetical protein
LKNRIAEDTGGQYFTAQTASELVTVLPSIVEDVSTTLVLKDVSLDIQFRFSPNEYSAINADNIFLAGAASYQIPSEGRVTTQKRRQLPSNQGITIRIPVTSFTPIPPGSPPNQTQVRLPCLTTDAVVSYHLGDRQIETRRINQVYVT